MEEQTINRPNYHGGRKQTPSLQQPEIPKDHPNRPKIGAKACPESESEERNLLQIWEHVTLARSRGGRPYLSSSLRAEKGKQEEEQPTQEGSPVDDDHLGASLQVLLSRPWETRSLTIENLPHPDSENTRNLMSTVAVRAGQPLKLACDHGFAKCAFASSLPGELPV